MDYDPTALVASWADEPDSPPSPKMSRRVSFNEKLEQSLTIARTLDKKGPSGMPPSPGTVAIKHSHSKVHHELVLGLNAVVAETKFRVSELQRERQWAEEEETKRTREAARKAEARRTRKEAKERREKEKEESSRGKWRNLAVVPGACAQLNAS